MTCRLFFCLNYRFNLYHAAVFIEFVSTRIGGHNTILIKKSSNQ